MNETANLNDHVAGEKRWLEHLAAFADSAATQLGTMGMPDMRYALETSLIPNAKLTLYFERVVSTLERLHSNRAASLAEESRMLMRTSIPLLHPQPLLLHIRDQLLELAHAN